MSATLPTLTPEQRHDVALQFERACQFLSQGQVEQAKVLLLHCCRVDPTNLSCRRALRNAQRTTSGWRAWLKWLWFSWRVRLALKRKDWLSVLVLTEELLCLRPFDVSANLALAAAFEGLGLVDHAIACLTWDSEWLDGSPYDAALVRLYERRGNWTLANELRRAGEVLDDLTLPEKPTKAHSSAEYRQLANQFLQEGHLWLAKCILGWGLQTWPNDFTLATELADLETEYLRRDLAITQEKLRIAPQDTWLEELRNRLVQEINTREIGLFQQQADRFPGELKYRLELGIRLLKAGQFDEALAAFETARADERYRWRALVYAGYCQLNRRKWPLAAKLFEEALPLVPASEEATRRELVSLLAAKGYFL
jgi:hypothetical protein